MRTLVSNRFRFEPKEIPLYTAVEDILLGINHNANGSSPIAYLFINMGDLMTHLLKLVAYFLGEPIVDLYFTSFPSDPWGLDSRLDVHLEVDDVDNGLDDGCLYSPSTWGADSHEGLSFIEEDSWTDILYSPFPA